MSTGPVAERWKWPLLFFSTVNSPAALNGIVLIFISHLFVQLRPKQNLHFNMFSPNMLQRSWSINRRQIGFGWSTRTTPVPELTNLNDTCLNRIFSFIELQDIIKFRRVCSRWKRLIEEFCKQKQVLILAGIELTGRRSLNTMILSKFEPVSLAGIFPQLQQLTIHFDRKCSTDVLIRFLKLQPYLVKLSLTGHAYLNTKAQLATLLQTINGLPNLTHLELHLNNLLTESDLTTNLFFLLPQLEHLSANCPFNLYPVLKQLKLIKSLELNSVLTTGDVLKKAMVKNKHLQKGLTKLKLTGLKKDSDTVLLVTGKALSIQELDLNEVLLTSDLIKSLKKLKTFFALHLDTIRVDRKLYHLKMSSIHQINSLTTLTIRNLYLTDDLTADILAKTLAAVFPNLLTLIISSFNVCLLWELEKHRSAFKFIKEWKLIDLGESSDSTHLENDNLNASEFPDPPVDHSSMMNVSIAPSEMSFHSLAFAIEKVLDFKTSEEMLEPIIEQDPHDSSVEID